MPNSLQQQHQQQRSIAFSNEQRPCPAAAHPAITVHLFNPHHHALLCTMH
jgi:hypothetical protein